MSTEELFFIREPWQYDPAFSRPARPDDDLGFDTQALHAGFRPIIARARSTLSPRRSCPR